MMQIDMLWENRQMRSLKKTANLVMHDLTNKLDNQIVEKVVMFSILNIICQIANITLKLYAHIK